MKIHILFEKGVKKKSINWVMNTSKEYFENKFVGVHIDKPFNLEFSVGETKLIHEYIYGGKQSEGRNYYTTNFFDKLKENDSEIPDEVEVVVYLYNNKFITIGSDYVAPRTYPTSIKKGVHYFEMYTDFEQLSPTAPVHELMHILCIKLSEKGFIPRGVSDNMDVTYIKGVTYTYLENSNPLSLTGNFAITFKHIKQLLDYVSVENKATLTQRIKSQITALQLQLEKSLAIKEPYRHFRLDEKTGAEGTIADLNKNLMTMIDDAREYAGIPFSITSGHRSIEHNKKVGGVKDSAHLSGLAVDIKATTGEDKLIIVGALLKAGFERIGVSWKGNFVHADIDKSKPKTLYTY